MSGKREYGDYQTPDSFALSVCEYLKEKRGINPAVVIEIIIPKWIQDVGKIKMFAFAV